MRILTNNKEETKSLAINLVTNMVGLPRTFVCKNCHNIILIEDSDDFECILYNITEPYRSEFFWSCPACATKNVFSPASYK
jgi:hypothetical protein